MRHEQFFELRRAPEFSKDGFKPFNGAWGRRGCTRVSLETAEKPNLPRAHAS